MIFIPAVILLQIAEVRKMTSLSSKTKDFIGAQAWKCLCFSFSHYFWTHFIADDIAHLNSGKVDNRCEFTNRIFFKDIFRPRDWSVHPTGYMLLIDICVFDLLLVGNILKKKQSGINYGFTKVKNNSILKLCRIKEIQQIPQLFKVVLKRCSCQ